MSETGARKYEWQQTSKHCGDCQYCDNAQPTRGLYPCSQALKRMEGRDYCLQWRPARLTD